MSYLSRIVTLEDSHRYRISMLTRTYREVVLLMHIVIDVVKVLDR